MRILFCASILCGHGGIQRVTTVKANAFAEIEGNEVAICLTYLGDFINNMIYPLSPKVKIFDLGNPIGDISMLSLKNLFWETPKRLLTLRSRLKGVIDDYNPDVIVTTGLLEKFPLAFIREGKQRIKIREYHQNSNFREIVAPGSFTAKLFSKFDNDFLCRFFDKSFLLTYEDQDKNFHGNPRFDVMHNPCTINTDSPPAPNTKRKNKIIAIGRITYQKNFTSLLRIWQKVAPKYTDWQLEIVGGGDIINLQHFIQEHNIPNVNLVGFRNDVDMLLNESKIFVMTSRYEGFSLVTLEAMSKGVAPIAYKCPYGPADIIEDGKNGLLVENQNEEEFAQKLSLLIENEDIRQRIAAEAVNRARDFAVDKIIAQWIEKYKALLAQKQGTL